MILVTTPTGKVGSEIVQQLQKQGAAFKVASRNPSRFQNGVAFDYAKPETFAPALAGVEAVYFASPGDQSSAPEIALLEEARKAGVRKVVKLSAMGVENTDAPIRQTEKAIEASGLEYTFVRPTWFLQNFSTTHAASIKAGKFFEPAADAKTAFIDTRDIAAVAVAALTSKGHEGKAYTLTGSTLYSRDDVAAAIGKEIGKTVQYVAISDEQFRAAVTGQMPQSYVELLSHLYEIVRNGWTAHVSNDVEKVLGRDPISLTKFVADHRASWI